MSGGHFDYDQNRIKYVVERLESYLAEDNDYSRATIEKMHDGLEALRIAYIYAQRIDWLLSGDDGEESFHERLDEELSKVIPDFVEVGNNTLHGAIDYWQDRAHKAEQRLAEAEAKKTELEKELFILASDVFFCGWGVNAGLLDKAKRIYEVLRGSEGEL